MTIAETHQEECPNCKSPLMFVTEGTDLDDNRKFVDYYCPDCEYSLDTFPEESFPRDHKLG